LDSALRPVAFFRRVLSEAFRDLVAILATSLGATWATDVGRLRLRVNLLAQLLAFPDVRCSLGGGEIGANQVLVDLNQLGLIRLNVVENGAVDLPPFEFLRRLEGGVDRRLSAWPGCHSVRFYTPRISSSPHRTLPHRHEAASPHWLD
jgi:hypothetical protein